ncbi:MAG: hypothetical protein ABSG51_02900, partial [Terracidiphilus sp.]
MFEPDEPSEEELEGERWHEKIRHEDQTELFSGATETPKAVEGKPDSPAEEVANPSHVHPVGGKPDRNREFVKAAKAGDASEFGAEWKLLINRLLQNPTGRYAILSVLIGVLAGVTIAALSWYQENPSGRYDLGPVTSDATGLRGRLFVKWDKNLKYQLTLGPSDKDYNAGFSLTAGNPPRPLSVAIQLKDVQGFELCSKAIVLRYDKGRAEAVAPLVRPNERAEEGTPENGMEAEHVLAQMDAQKAERDQEADREKDKDVFDLETGPDGQIASIGAHGVMPCTRGNYVDATSWSFVPDFPSIAEQGNLLRNIKEKREYAENLAYEASHPKKGPPKKPAPNTVV